MYKITERISRNAPSCNDPMAQAFRRHSGMYDMRDTLNGSVIVASTTNLTALRKYQAVHNTRRVLDDPATSLDTTMRRAILRAALNDFRM